MARKLTSHKVNGLNDELGILVLDDPGVGNGCHQYRIGKDASGNALSSEVWCAIDFQRGPVGRDGLNGVSNESLLAIVEDRLASYQSGEFRCRENALALTHIQEALHWLHHRTRDRVQRGVEGTYDV